MKLISSDSLLSFYVFVNVMHRMTGVDRDKNLYREEIVAKLYGQTSYSRIAEQNKTEKLNY